MSLLASVWRSPQSLCPAQPRTTDTEITSLKSSKQRPSQHGQLANSMQSSPIHVSLPAVLFAGLQVSPPPLPVCVCVSVPVCVCVCVCVFALLSQPAERSRNEMRSETRALCRYDGGATQRPVVWTKVEYVTLLGHDPDLSWAASLPLNARPTKHNHWPASVRPPLSPRTLTPSTVCSLRFSVAD